MQVAITASEELNIDPATFVFSPQDWDQPRVVQVAAVDDLLVEPTEVARVQFTLRTVEGERSALVDTRSLAFSIADNDAEQTGSTSGRLWHDANRDGLAQDAEDGLAGWTVFVDDNDNGRIDTAEPVTRSDLDGRWRLSDLPPGAHDVLAIPRAGWAPTSASEQATSGTTLIDADPGEGSLTVDDLRAWSVDASQAQTLARQRAEPSAPASIRVAP